MYPGKSRFLTASMFLALMGGASFWLGPSVVGAENASAPHVHQTGMAHQESSGWAEQLKGQTRVEDALEGRAGLSEKIEVQHHRIMRRLEEQGQQDAQVQANSGVFNNVSMMHQYMGQDGSSYLLAVDPDAALSTGSGAKCPAGVPTKHYDISMIDTEITLNRWLDYYVGYMYVLTDNIDKVRAEEAQNKAARDKDGWDPGAVTTGLQGDYIQPLAIRANQGDCLKITLRNQMEIESGSLHVNGGSMVMSTTGKAASTSNPETVVEPGNSVEMEWYIHPQTQEGVRRFHSYSNARELTVMGLFGALIVEPAGSKYLDPLGTGPAPELQSGWQAIIDNGSGHDFREYIIFYHEVGDEAFRPVNKKGDFLPQRDPLTDAYRPGGRALNYRSEPFGIDEMHVQHEYFGFEDESLAYSAYTFGDAPTTIPRGYLGDPMKYRIVHGGSEVFHSHHPHSGSIRWQRSPRADQQEHWYLGKDGPVKYPVVRTKSDRVDVEVIGPSEALDLEPECGSGGCQHLAGDFLFHCHVAHHYVAGMWGYGRVYNTLQVGDVRTDIMADLRELPDRQGRVKVGVSSDKLIGTTVDWFGKQFKIVDKSQKSNWKSNPAVVNIKDWVEMYLPAMGKPGHTDDEKGQVMAYDGTVWDWKWDGNVAKGERESTTPHPKYPTAVKWDDSTRPDILFDPTTGKVAWPVLKPHFGKRVPFSANHSGAPWLEPIHQDENGERTSEPAKPGEQGRWSLCPEGANVPRLNNIHFIRLPIELTPKQGNQESIVDQDGLIYVLHEEERLTRADNNLKYPAVLRANVYDCVDTILTSEWDDDDYTNFQSSKINIHPHFFQFDTGASDGVISGMEWEMSVRPFTMFSKPKKAGLPVPMNSKLTKAVKAGAKSITIKMAEGASKYHVNTELLVGADCLQADNDPTTSLKRDRSCSEIARIKEIKGETITFVKPLKHDHPTGDIVTPEFVRYRYWVDSDTGTVFWHDHAFGATTWPHGGFGATIVEPFGSTYHDPKNGKLVYSGPIADIHTNEPVGFGVSGSFRELMVSIHDTVPHTVNVIQAGNPPGQPIEVALEAGKTVSFQMPEKIQNAPNPFLNGGTHTTGSGFNFRAEPFALRLNNNPDTSKLFSSAIHGDPDTPLLQSYVGDTIVFRLLHQLMNESHVWTLSGHTFLTERYAGDANRKYSIHVGIAERYDLVTKAGGFQGMPGDYIHFNGRSSHFAEGGWGIIRVLDKKVPDLQVLPMGTNPLGIPPVPSSLCPADAPVKSFNVVSLDRPLKLHPNAPDTIEVDFERKIEMTVPDGKIFALEEEATKVAGNVMPNPLTLRVNLGDCIKVNLKNKMAKSRASFFAPGLAFDPRDSHGLNVGNNPGDQTVAPGESRTYTFYAHPDNKETTSLVWDGGNIILNPRNGLYGAVIVGPKGSQYRDPVTGEDLSQKNAWRADVIIDHTLVENAGKQNYRDVALFFQDEDNIIGTSFMPYVQNVAGLSSVNYRAEPDKFREEQGCTLDKMFQPCAVDKPVDPVTPLIEAHAGDVVRIHVIGANSEQNGMFQVEGHEWPIEPYMPGADMISVVEFGGSETLDVFLRQGAGGPANIPGDYIWANARLNYQQAGQWGYLRVLPTGDQRILPLGATMSNAKRVESQPEPKVLPTAMVRP
ncbi:multicopper oxidase domain-containing protein [Candidatus Nitrospira neomarina]|uniref:Multicopper oxidase domain-containing protein n=1 Tax=Candidatus Nitrospira neomarina TaxID=3020899 RepID=A0AA96GIG2_9BACT|nr:multicopper oxidase domain-containing protein [Candidatus Nitrospira neomarina]WNM62511.1 multicopper oxidase domain-containing protein [Candidatus Nitrospira neomarina]